MSTFREVSLGDLLVPAQDAVPVIPDGTYRTAGIYSYGRGLFARPPIQGAETNYSRYFRLRAGQFVYSKLFAWEGALAVVGNEHDGLLVSGEFPTFDIVTTKLHPSWLNHLCAWPELHRRLREHTSGMGNRRQRVNVDRLLSVRIPLPSIAMQRRIAERINGTLNLTDDLGKSDVASLTGSLLRSSFPVDAPMALADEVLELRREPASIKLEDSYREIGIRSFGRGVFHKPGVPGAVLGKKKVFWIRPDELVLNIVFAWEGAVAVSSIDELGMIGSHRFLSFASKGGVEVRYLHYYLLSEKGMQSLRAASPGSAGRNRTLSIKAFLQVPVPVPDLGEQRRVADALDIAFGRLAAAYEKRRQLAEAMRPAVLNAAFSGRL